MVCKNMYLLVQVDLYFLELFLPDSIEYDRVMNIQAPRYGSMVLLRVVSYYKNMTSRGQIILSK